MSKTKNTHTWLAGLLTGWGIKESWAKVIAGAVIGALVAAGVLSMPSCESVTPAQIHTAHELYHALSDEHCIFVIDSK
jgi:hypothetical protein